MRVLSSLGLLLGSALLAPTEAEKILRAPLQKVSRNQAESNGLITNFLALPEISMRNHFDYLYVATVEMGDKNIPFSIMLDTGSATFWLPHSQLAGKNHTQVYDCSKSSQCKIIDEHRILPVEYGDGKMEGFPVTDRLKIGDAVIEDFKFLLATKTEFPNNGNFDGLMGLSPELGADKAPTVLQRMLDAKLIEKRQFSMYLGTLMYSRGASTGEIIFGGYDPFYMKSGEEFKYIQADPKDIHWKVALKALKMGDATVSTGETSVIIDSGTSLIYMPESFVTNIKSEAAKRSVRCGGWDANVKKEACDCKGRSVLPDLTVEFANLTLSIPASAYIESRDNKCYLVVQTHQDRSRNLPNILGDVFLKNYYTLYDQENYLIGFAQAAPISMWKNWLLAGLIFGSMAVIFIALYFYLREKKASNPASAFSRAGGGGISSLFNRGNQGVTLGGGSGNNPRSRLLDNQEMH